ncbi:hypothetical protein ONZ43_g2495 [Nemania bipapillata]|uniref:Uncharacterized protein n=1 Tax=Nemania bipapillata TaxID=110536 RepID=A0ACC2J0C2_9PEZI|nr:hypothetical protein ONZ43_g2495 [Nemania bipapillata]
MQFVYKALFVWALVIQASAASVALPRARSGAQVHAYTSINASISVNASANISIGANGGAVMPQWMGPGDICSGTGKDTFELGKEYHENDCPAINHFLPDGMCDWATKQSDQTKNHIPPGGRGSDPKHILSWPPALLDPPRPHAAGRGLVEWN